MAADIKLRGEQFEGAANAQSGDLLKVTISCCVSTEKLHRAWRGFRERDFDKGNFSEGQLHHFRTVAQLKAKFTLEPVLDGPHEDCQ